MIIIYKDQKIEEDQVLDQIGQDMDLNLEKSLKIDQDMEGQDQGHLEDHMDQCLERDQEDLEDHMDQCLEIDQMIDQDLMEGLMDHKDQRLEID